MANKVYVNDEADVLIGSEVGDDIALSSESIADGAGRQSATIDLGAAPRASIFKVEGWTQAVATPTLGAHTAWHLKSAGSETATPDHWTNDDGTGDIAVSATDKLKNCPLILSTIVDEAAANIEYGSKGIREILARHIAIIQQVEMGSAVTADAAETKFRLTPMPDEIQ